MADGVVIKNWQYRGRGLNPCVGKILWRRKWPPTPVYSCLGNPMDRGARVRHGWACTQLCTEKGTNNPIINFLVGPIHLQLFSRQWRKTSQILKRRSPCNESISTRGFVWSLGDEKPPLSMEKWLLLPPHRPKGDLRLGCSQWDTPKFPHSCSQGPTPSLGALTLAEL